MGTGEETDVEHQPGEWAPATWPQGTNHPGLLGFQGGARWGHRGVSSTRWPQALSPEPEEETEQPTLDYNDQIEREDYEDCE